MPTFEVTICTGDKAEIRPLTRQDLIARGRAADANDPIDERWMALRWLGENETPAPGFDCVAWLDRGRLFLASDGQGGLMDYDPRGPQTEYVPARTDAQGRVIEEARINGHWYDAATGERAVSRSNAPLWSTRTGPLGEPNIELREVSE